MKTHSEREPSRLQRLDNDLLSPIQEVFTRVRATYPGVLPCSRGCSSCCVASFEITVLDLWRLWRAWAELPPQLTKKLVSGAREVISRLSRGLTTWGHPYHLGDLPPGHFDLFLSSPPNCPALGPQGECTIYPYRPRICRLQGLSYVDPSGAADLPDYCAEVFGDPAYAALAPQPLTLLDQWEKERELRGLILAELPEMFDRGYVTVVAGAVLVVARWCGDDG